MHDCASILDTIAKNFHMVHPYITILSTLVE